MSDWPTLINIKERERERVFFFLFRSFAWGGVLRSKPISKFARAVRQRERRSSFQPFLFFLWACLSNEWQREKRRVALTLMTIISAALGYIVPNLISKQTTHNASTLLYTFFGLRLLYIGYNSKKNVMHEEIAEVNQKLVSYKAHLV